MSDDVKARDVLDSAPPVTRALPDREALIEVAEGVDIIREKGETRTYPTRILDAVLAAIETAPVVSDDTEWEYRCNFPGLGWVACPDGRDCIYPSRRRSVGPWVAVEKGGESA